MGFSPTYLSSLIKKELGLPFQDYLVRERVKQAKLLLLTTDLKILWRSQKKVGFEDMNYFTQRFKQIAGVTPRHFKKGGRSMKRSSLLVRMVISIFLVFLILLALVGTFYYQSSSSAIEATIEGNSQTTISQTSHFIQSYIKKLETTSTSLPQQADVLSYAENPSQKQISDSLDLVLTGILSIG